ncbi:MAG: PilZ domain-containing protein [Oligoflexia bacterium]|nr:PilZ domain-containing protein [Oligoflexia bacterium]
MSSSKFAYWYIAQDLSSIGPLMTAEVVRKIDEGVASWVDFVWRYQSQDGWVRICDAPDFQSFLPKKPTTALLAQVKVSAAHDPYLRKALRTSVWFLEFQGSEFGPLGQSEVEAILKNGKLKGALRIRKDGRSGWKPIEEVVEFKGVLIASPGVKSESERRNDRRTPLVATVQLSLQKGQFTGVCRDISQNGLLILSNCKPPTESPFLLKVTPLEEGTDLAPFKAEVQLVRMLGDLTGFSVRFTKVEKAVTEAIGQYLRKKV